MVIAAPRMRRSRRTSATSPASSSASTARLSQPAWSPAAAKPAWYRLVASLFPGSLPTTNSRDSAASPSPFGGGLGRGLLEPVLLEEFGELVVVLGVVVVALLVGEVEEITRLSGLKRGINRLE